MKKIVLLAVTMILAICGWAQDVESFLQVDDFKPNEVGVFIRPEGMKKTDNNGKPWAMIEIVAKGFDGALLKDLTVFSSSSVRIGYAGYKSEDNSYNLILSSDVKGSITIKYQGTMIEYPLPYPLLSNKVYTLTLAMRSANLTILATPTEAKIYVDGREVGSDGYASIDLKLGEHVYSVECEDYFAEKNKVIKLNSNMRIKVQLKPLFGFITVNSEPQGADLYIDGARVGVTPYNMKKIKRGQHNIELQLNGFISHAELVDIDVSEEKTLDIQLVGYGNVAGVNNMTNLTLRLSQDSLYFDSEPGQDSIFVTTNTIDWNFNEAPRWLSLYRRNNILFVTCMKNAVHESREADVVVYTGDLTKNLHIYQDAGKAVLKSKQKSMVFDANRDTIPMQLLEANVFNWSIKTSDDWITAYEKGDSLIVICDENNLPISRYGKVNVRAYGVEMNVEVEQKSHVTKFTAPKEDFVMDAAGGSMAIPIGIVGEKWSCISNDPWLEVSQSGDVVLLGCDANESFERRGSFTMNTGTKAYKINVTQKGAISKPSEIIIDTKPTKSKIYIDEKYKGKTPLKVAVDDSVHFVRHDKNKESYIFNSNLESIKFTPGLRYLQLTASSETFGFRTGFIGVKRWGGYNHFQMNTGHWDFDPDNKKAPLYVYTLGPSFEIFPWMSAYVGLGLSMTNDNLGSIEINDTIIRKTGHKKLHWGLAMDAGLMFYYRNFILSGGIIQVTNMGSIKSHTDFSVGLGMYFTRFYDQRYGYCAAPSRRWWSLNHVFNPVRNGYGLMFSDIGKQKTRVYLKAMAEFPQEDVFNIGGSMGVVFNTIPGYIDLLVGVGIQGSIESTELSSDNIEAEIGFTLNLWRFPLGIMFRSCEFLSDSRYVTVDFSFGFSFGEFYDKK